MVARVTRPILPLRAVAGGLLVTLALLGVSQAYAAADRPPATRYAVATGTLPPGTTLGPDDLALVPADLPEATAARAFRSIDALRGAVTLAPLAAGEPLLLSQVLPAGLAPAAGADVAFALDRDRALGGDVRPGETVDLVATFPAGPPRTVARSALVLDAAAAGNGLLGDEGTLVLTVRVAGRDDVLPLVEAVDEGRLTVVRVGASP